MATAPLLLDSRADPLPAPAAGAAERAPWRLPRWLGPVALVAVVLFLRRPDVWLHPQFFLEDGMFFEQNYYHGLGALFIPYAGYLHMVIRLVAWTAGFLPLAVQPALYNAAATALCLAVVARIFRPGIHLPHKWLFALAVPLIPHDGFGEIIGNLTDVQWFLALVPVLTLIEDAAPTGWRAARDLVLLALAGLSGPFILMSLPLFAAKWVRVARSRWNARCLGVATVCGAVQAWFVHRQPDWPVASPTLNQWLAYLAWKPVGPLFFGNVLSARYLAPGAAVAAVAGLGALLWTLNRRRPEWLWPTAVFVGFGGATLLGSISRFVREPAVFLPVNSADRYFFLPRVLLIWSLLVHLRTQTGWRRWTLLTALLAAVAASAADFACQTLPDGRWDAQVAALERGETDSLKVMPGWRIFLDRLPADGGRYADVLGKAPLRLAPPENATRVTIGAQSFLQIRSSDDALVYEAPAQSRVVTGHYAAAPGEERAVEFSVYYLASNEKEVHVLWHGRLDPAHVPADRGGHDFEAPIPPQVIGRIILGFQPVSGEGTVGGCWADVRFR